MYKAVLTIFLIVCSRLISLGTEQPSAFISVLNPQEYLGTKVPIQVEVITQKGQTVQFPNQLTLPAGLESMGKTVIHQFRWENASTISKQIFYVMALDSGYFIIQPQIIKISQKGQKDIFSKTDSCFLKINRIKVNEQNLPLDIIKPLKVRTGISMLWIYIPSGLIVAALIATLFLFLKKKRSVILPKGANPYQWALSELSQLKQSLPWNDAVQSVKFNAVYDVLRTYLNSEIPSASLDLTTEELAIHLRGIIPEATFQSLITLLSDCDSIKFAKFTADTALQQSMLKLAVNLVHEVAHFNFKDGGGRD